MKNSESFSLSGFLANPTYRSWFFQFIVLLVLALGGYYFYHNVTTNLLRLNIASGMGFLDKEAGFEVSESVISYSSADNYKRVLIVGILNTLKVALIGNFFAIILGVFLGIFKLSKNWILSKSSSVFIETIRNIPLLLQLFFWYTLFTDIFPSVKESLNPLPYVFLSNRGIAIPILENVVALKWIFLAIFFSWIAVFYYLKKVKQMHENMGRELPVKLPVTLILLGLPILMWIINGTPTRLSLPELMAFNFNGGFTFGPEFCALLFGLIIYTACFIAEITRSGILSVDKGQIEAAKSLGLKGPHIMFFIILPQALRVIIPPLTSQLLNLTKNSSLAVAIAYPDFVSVANTTLNQTGQAIELIGLIIVVYLSFSIVTSLFMNWYNKKMALVER